VRQCELVIEEGDMLGVHPRIFREGRVLSKVEEEDEVGAVGVVIRTRFLPSVGREEVLDDYSWPSHRGLRGDAR